VRPIDTRHFLVLTAFFVWDAAAMGATFALTETVVANQRQKNDPLNGVAGGCAAGFLAGIRGALIVLYPFVILVFTFVILARSLPMAAAGCAAVGAAVGGFDYSGQLVGQTASPEKREERRRQFFKQPRPQPTESTE
jgi:hypothetical protein